LAAAETMALTAGAMFLKHVKGGSPHERFVFLADDGSAICWVENQVCLLISLMPF
jgi:hypothetical protein